MNGKTSLLWMGVGLMAGMGCASPSSLVLQQERGYASQDIQSIRRYSSKYSYALKQARLHSTLLRPEVLDLTVSELMAIYCTCVEEMGADRCRTSGAQLSSSEREIWAQSNAAELSLNNSNLFSKEVTPQQCAQRDALSDGFVKKLDRFRVSPQSAPMRLKFLPPAPGA
jgi:hypothetical protein